jgi:hypothetical protein
MFMHRWFDEILEVFFKSRGVSVLISTESAMMGKSS